VDFFDPFERGVVGQESVTFGDDGSGNLEGVGESQVIVCSQFCCFERDGFIRRVKMDVLRVENQFEKRFADMFISVPQRQDQTFCERDRRGDGRERQIVQRIEHNIGARQVIGITLDVIKTGAVSKNRRLVLPICAESFTLSAPGFVHGGRQIQRENG